MAQFGLAVLYLRGGEFLAKNEASAFKWFSLAAAQNHSEAQRFLGTMYGFGIGISKDYIRSYMWLSLAIKNGDVDAVRYREILELKMTTDQILEAQELPAKCFESNYKDCE